MKLTGLIEYLQGVLEREGDLDVNIWSSNTAEEWHSEPYEPAAVEIDPRKGVITL